MIKQLLKEYKLDVEHMTVSDICEPNSVKIFEGSNEGYYIDVVLNCKHYSMRQHDYNEAIKIMGVMLKVINPKR
jgi:hypothetical protein